MIATDNGIATGRSMKNSKISANLEQEIHGFIAARKSLHLATLMESGAPYASYAPYASGPDCFYVLLSDIAVHGLNLQHHPIASVLIVEDEDSASELFARKRLSYQVRADRVQFEDDLWQPTIQQMAHKLGPRIYDLSKLADFHLFTLTPTQGRFVKGFGRAYAFSGESFTGTALDHLRDGHRPRDVKEGAI